jgi:Flp pilus assembly pilin Flp
MTRKPTSTPEAARRLDASAHGKPSLASLARDERGAQLVEYIILVGMVAIVAMAGFKTFGFQVRAKIDQQGDTVTVIPGQ